MQVGAGQKEEEERTPSRLRAVRADPDGGLEPTNREIRPEAEVRRLRERATQVPPKLAIFK